MASLRDSLRATMTQTANKRAPGQRRLSLLVRFGCRWPGVPERGRSAEKHAHHTLPCPAAF